MAGGLARAKDLTAEAMQSLDDLSGTGDPMSHALSTLFGPAWPRPRRRSGAPAERAGPRRNPEVLKRKELEANSRSAKRDWAVGENSMSLVPIIITLAAGLIAIGVSVYFWTAASRSGRRTQGCSPDPGPRAAGSQWGLAIRRLSGAAPNH